MKGIYIVANDKVLDNTIALLKSIRLYDSDTPIMMIPFDENYQQVAEIVTSKYGVEIYPDLEFVDNLCNKLYNIFGQGFFNTPNKQKKQACWFGPFDEFLYIDVDIVVFEKIADNLKYLEDYDFLCCDYQHLGGIKNVFTSKVVEDKIFTEEQLKDVFNSGWWASKKNLFTENELYETFAECAANTEYFDFSEKTTDQPIFNYIVLKHISRRLNLVRRPEGKGPGSWAGSPHFQREGDRLIDTKVGKPVQYLHWAGFRIEPGCPYWDIWEHYRYLGEAKPTYYPQKTEKKKNLGEKFIDQVKNIARQIKKS